MAIDLEIWLFGKKTRRVRNWVGNSGLFRIQQNSLVPLLFLVFLTLNTNILQLHAVTAERAALSTNKTLEAAVGQMALNELLDSYELNSNEQKTFAPSSMRRTLRLLEILSETGQISLLDQTFAHDMLLWLSHSKTAPLNSSSPSRFWWGTIDRSLDAARILKLLGHLNETVVADITGQIIESFGGSEPVFSLTHKDNDKVYAAFITAYDYDLFDLLSDYEFPLIDSEAVTIVERELDSFTLPTQWGEVISKTAGNVTYHAGSIQIQSLLTGEVVNISLSTLGTTFGVDGAYQDYPVPYQTIDLSWATGQFLPNNEEDQFAIEIGLTEEVFTTFNETMGGMSQNDSRLFEELDNEYGLEKVDEQTIITESGETIITKTYRHLKWNPDLLWYEMLAIIRDSETGEEILREPLLPDLGEASINLDLINCKDITLEIIFRQALHSLTLEWDNKKYLVPLEGWKNETQIQFSLENTSFHLNPVEGVLKTQYWAPKILAGGNLSENLFLHTDTYSVFPETVNVIELDETLHTFRYQDSFPRYNESLQVSVKGQPVYYGEIEKQESEGTLFIDVGGISNLGEGGGVYSWPTSNLDHLDSQRRAGVYQLGMVMDQLAYTHQTREGVYSVLLL